MVDFEKEAKRLWFAIQLVALFGVPIAYAVMVYTESVTLLIQIVVILVLFSGAIETARKKEPPS